MKVWFAGNAGADPDLRYSAKGEPFARLNVAWTSYNGKDRDKYTKWFSVVCFGEMAEHVASSVTKGDRVIVGGTLQASEWTDQAGVAREQWTVVADEIGLSVRFRDAFAERPAERVRPARPAVNEDDEPF